MDGRATAETDMVILADEMDTVMTERQRAAEQLHKASQYMFVLAAVLSEQRHAEAAKIVTEQARRLTHEALRLERE